MGSFNLRKGFRYLTTADLRGVYQWVRDYVTLAIGGTATIYTGDGDIRENRTVNLETDTFLTFQSASSIVTDGVNVTTIGLDDVNYGFFNATSSVDFGASLQSYLDDSSAASNMTAYSNGDPDKTTTISAAATPTSSEVSMRTEAIAFAANTSVSFNIISDDSGNSITIIESDGFEIASSLELINGEVSISFNGGAGSQGLTLTDNGTASVLQVTGGLGGGMVITSGAEYPLSYNADYSANIDDRSIPDVGYINSLTGRYVDAAAAITGGVVIGEVWYDTTANKYMVRLS